MIPTEIELKLALTPASLIRLSTHPVFQNLKTTPSIRKTLASTYFDTSDQRLRKADISLRIRQDGTQFIQTIKKSNDSGTLLLSRNEWETPVKKQSKIDFTAAQNTALATFIETAGDRDKIQPQFTIDVDREVVLLKYSTSIIEIALDRGRISIGQMEDNFAEVELELKTGTPADLYTLACAFADIVPMRPTNRIKADRGFDILNAHKPEPMKASPLTLERGTSSGNAFQIIARSCMKQFLVNEEILQKAPIPGAVHQARVGLRRLRAAISVFRSIVDDEQRSIISGELRWIANSLGDARDTDVYINNVLEPASTKHADDPAYMHLLKHYSDQRKCAYNNAQISLASHRCAKAIMTSIAWIETGSWTQNDNKKALQRRNQPIEKFAVKQMDRRRLKIIKEAANLASLETEERHELRIALKKLRYSAEFFAALFHKGETNKRYKAAVSIMSKLQDLLGELNDIAVGHKRDTLSEAERTLRNEHASHEKELIKKAERTYNEFVDLKPFWHEKS